FSPRLLLSCALAPPARTHLSLHDALPILRAQDRPRRRLADRRGDQRQRGRGSGSPRGDQPRLTRGSPLPRPPFHVKHPPRRTVPDRKSTRLNSSHQIISYAVFCLKTKNNT